tara:strand:+ start:878 stop:1600 length:723 start_codon:yes stop_codon:yes gene_type:complete
MASYKRTEEDYKRFADTSKDVLGNPTGIEPGARREERRGKRAEIKTAKQNVKQALEEQKALGDVSKAGPMDLDRFAAAHEKVTGALSKKADIKDWSTRKRVRLGEKYDTQIHEDAPAIYEPGRKKVSAKDVTQKDIGADIADIDKSRWRNVYTAKGDYKYTVPHEGPGETDITDLFKPRERTPKPQKEKKKKSRIRKAKKGRRDRAGESSARAKYLKNGKHRRRIGKDKFQKRRKKRRIG